MNTETLTIELAQLNGAAVLVLHGEIDMATAPRLDEALRQAQQLGVPIVLDMSEVCFIDSSGLKVIASSHDHPNPLQVNGQSEQVRRILSITGLDQVLSPAAPVVDGTTSPA